MDKALEEKLLAETVLEDIPDRYQKVAELIGVENMVKLSRLTMGAEVYFPKVESIYREARNRNIRKEYTGYNGIELARKYDLTIDQIGRILKDYNPRQLSLFDI